MVVSSEQTESSKQKAQLEAHTELPTHRVLMCGVSNMYYNATVLICVCSKSATVWITFSIRHCKESSGRNGGSLQRVRQPFDIHNIESHYKVFWALTKALFSILMFTWY